MGDHEHHSGRIASRDHRVTVGDADAHRLLQEHVLATHRSSLDQRPMGRVGRADRDGIDVLTVDQRLHRRFDRDTQPRPERRRACPSGDGDKGAPPIRCAAVACTSPIWPVPMTPIRMDTFASPALRR